MRLIAPLAVSALAALAVYACTPAKAEGVVSNCPAAAPGSPALIPTDLLVAHLEREGWRREAWKLDRAGLMLELWSDASGAWIVTATSPQRCSWLVVDLGREGERLGDGHGLLRGGPMVPGDDA